MRDILDFLKTLSIGVLTALFLCTVVFGLIYLAVQFFYVLVGAAIIGAVGYFVYGLGVDVRKEIAAWRKERGTY